MAVLMRPNRKRRPRKKINSAALTKGLASSVLTLNPRRLTTRSLLPRPGWTARLRCSSQFSSKSSTLGRFFRGLSIVSAMEHRRLVLFALADWLRFCSYVGYISRTHFKLHVYRLFVSQYVKNLWVIFGQVVA